MADEDTSPIQSATEGMPDASSAATILAGMNPPPTGPQPMEVTPSGPSQSAVAGVPQPPNPEVEREYHMGWLHSVLDKVGTALGGGETVHVTKDADGNVTMTRDPATTGEKWGRIAQAALSGAGAGFANSTGPNAPAAAAAAGIQAGAQQGQQERQQAQQEATAEQQLQLRNAQKALVQQQIAKNTFEAKVRGIELNQAQSERANAVQDWIQSNKTNKEVGAFDNIQDAMDYEKLHGDLISGHTNGMFHTETMPDGKVHLYTLDQAWLDQKNDKDITYREPTVGEDGKIGFKDHVILSGTHTNREIEQITENAGKTSLEYSIKLADLNEKNNTAAATARAAGARAQETARHNRVDESLRGQEIGIQRQKLDSPGGGDMEAALNAPYDANDQNDIMAEQLASGKQLQKDVFSRLPAAQRKYLNARATKLSQQMYGLDYNPSQISRENNFANNQRTQAYFKATTALLGGQDGSPGVLDNLYKAAQTAGFDDNPVHNATILAAAQHPVTAQLMDKNKLAAINGYIAARNEAHRNVTSAAGNPLLGSTGESDTKMKLMKETLESEAPTLSGLKSSIDQVKTSATAERTANMANNRFLKQTYGGGGAPGRETRAYQGHNYEKGADGQWHLQQPQAQ